MVRVVVIGAGPAGLAVAASLKERGITATVLERSESVGSAWRRHYDRLALHTDKARSNLPGLPFADRLPRYVPRVEVVNYLEAYAEHFGIAPAFGANITRLRRDGNEWHIAAEDGRKWQADHVILATGMADHPARPDWPGLESFTGKSLHSRDYRRPGDLPGERVLVVGFGNSGGELAIDLAEAGRKVDLAVRSPVNILPKELLGRPIGNWDILRRLFPYKVADALTVGLLRIVLGDYQKYGLKKSAKGPFAQIIEDGRIPLIDLGTLRLIRSGKIKVRPGIDSFNGNKVRFKDGAEAAYDALLLATGYKVDLKTLLPEEPDALDEAGRPRKSGGEIASGLWALSYHPSPDGQLRRIGGEAKAIADALSAL